MRVIYKDQENAAIIFVDDGRLIPFLKMEIVFAVTPGDPHSKWARGSVKRVTYVPSTGIVEAIVLTYLGLFNEQSTC